MPYSSLFNKDPGQGYTCGAAAAQTTHASGTEAENSNSKPVRRVRSVSQHCQATKRMKHQPTIVSTDDAQKNQVDVDVESTYCPVPNVGWAGGP